MTAIDRGASPAPEIVQFFKVLADETRLAIVRLLAVTDLRAGDVVARLRVPANAASYHFKHLRAAGLLRDRRSSLDARDVYYSVDLQRLQTLYQAAGGALHPALAPPADDAATQIRLAPPLRVLFLCTHNSARSQLAEGLMRQLGGEQVAVWSAGSQPAEVHPMTVRMLREMGIDPALHRSKSLDQLLDQPFDYVITVCDRVKEQCPTFPADPQDIHWSLPDPAAVADEEQRWQAFGHVCSELQTRIRYLLSLPHPATQHAALDPQCATGQASV
jgi:protein-tyrosine-phosphatase